MEANRHDSVVFNALIEDLLAVRRLAGPVTALA
jgi:hypothetical protein